MNWFLRLLHEVADPGERFLYQSMVGFLSFVGNNLYLIGAPTLW